MEHDLGPLAQIPPGEGRNFCMGGQRVAVFRTHADEVFATQPDCPHRQGPLADGLVGGTMLVCPLHDKAWDLRTGASLGTDAALVVHDVRLSPAGTIVVRLAA